MPIIGVIASSGDRNVPAAPTIGTATNVPSGRPYNNGRADVTFTAPTYTGGTPITGYTVTSSPGGFTGTGASSPISVTGLQSGVSYTFTVTATNAVGTGPASAASNSITATTVPQAPTIGTATDLGTGTSVSVAFTAGATGGTTPVTYTATSSPGGLTGTGASPITVSGLTAGTAYTFTVTATNANGSATSGPSNSVTPVVPTAFESIASATPSGSGTITFSSIPQTYKHLQVRVLIKGDTGAIAFQARLNGDTGNNYNRVRQYAYTATSGVQTVTGTTSSIDFGSQVGINATNGAPIVWDILDYSSSSKVKTMRSLLGTMNTDISEGNTTSSAYNWNSTSAITQIDFIPTGGIGAGSVIALYGIRG